MTAVTVLKKIDTTLTNESHVKIVRVMAKSKYTYTIPEGTQYGTAFIVSCICTAKNADCKAAAGVITIDPSGAQTTLEPYNIMYSFEKRNG